MSEPSLREVQRLMRSAIRPAGGLAGAGTAEAILNPQRGVPGAERLTVYAGGYLARTCEALEEVYDAVHHVVGEQAFAALARAYVQRHPSHDYNLSLVGRHLPEFLAVDPLSQRLPFLPDLARLERLVCQAFHAFDEPPVDPARLARYSLDEWEHARLTFQPSVGLIASPWPILDIWTARTQPRESVSIDLVDRPQRVLVFRHGLQTRCELVDEWQYRLLEGLLAGRALGTVCGELAGLAGSGPLPLADWCARWASRGLIHNLEV